MAEMFNSLIRNRLTLRDSNPEIFHALEQRMPLVTNHPNATAEAQGIATPGQVQQTAQAIQGGVGQQEQAQAQPPVQAPANQPPSQMGVLISQLLEDFNKDKSASKKPLGPAIFGDSGGILGSGLSPTTALMYALGGLITSNLPQEKALAMTMQIGQLPQQYQAMKAQLAENQVGTILQAFNAETAQKNLEVRQAEAINKTSEVQRKQEFYNSIPKDASNLNAQQKLRGVFAGALPASIIEQRTSLVDTIDSNGNPIKVVVGPDSQPVIDAQGRPTIFQQAPRGQELDVNTRTILAGARERGINMSIDQARAEAQRQAVEVARQRGVLLPEAVGQRQAIQESGVRLRERVEAEEQLGSLTGTQNQLDSLFRLADKIITAETTGQAIRQSAMLNAQGLVSSTNAGLYNNIKTGLADALARSLGGMRGVLTDRDIERVVNLFPSFGDTKATSQYKRGYLNNALSVAMDAVGARIEGKTINPADIRKKYNAILNELERGLNPASSRPSAAGKKVE